MSKKRDPGIKSYDPAKVGKDFAVTHYHCPHCWYATSTKGVLTRHIREVHWDITDE